jgi:hemerythrin-like metal-binding protein
MSRTDRGRRRRRPSRFIVVGHDAIDADHEAIFRCCSEIAAANAGALEIQLYRLRSLLSHHFEHEELLLKQAGSRLCGCHCRDHELFLELCDRAIEANREERSNSRKLILRELLPALQDHIAYRDQLIALHLNSLPNK